MELAAAPDVTATDTATGHANTYRHIISKHEDALTPLRQAVFSPGRTSGEDDQQPTAVSWADRSLEWVIQELTSAGWAGKRLDSVFRS